MVGENIEAFNVKMTGIKAFLRVFSPRLRPYLVGDL